MSSSPLRVTRLVRRALSGLLLLLAAGVHAEPLQIGAEDDWYPFTAFRDGAVRGMSAEIVLAAFAAVDTPVELVPIPTPAACSSPSRASWRAVSTPRRTHVSPRPTSCRGTRCSATTSCSGRVSTGPPRWWTCKAWRARGWP